MHFSIDRTVHTTAFDKPVVDHWLERKIAQTAAGSTEKDRSDDRPLQRRARYRLSYIPLFLPNKEREREMFYLTTHSTHFIYSYMASDIWLRTILIVREETRCRHIGYSYRLTARVLLYAPSHRQDNTYHGLCYTNRGALAGTRNSSMGPYQIKTRDTTDLNNVKSSQLGFNVHIRYMGTTLQLSTRLCV